jgi:polyferredoxin
MRISDYRLISQTAFFVLANLGFIGMTGLIYPFFYCYACPFADAACPIGILEHAILGDYMLFIYLLGFIGVIGVIFGRFFCGWACPVGFLQDIFGFLTGKKKIKGLKVKPETEHRLRYTKYIVLIGTIIATYITGMLAFTLICPIGGLTATLPTLIIYPGRYGFSRFFWVKIVGVILFFILIAVFYRGWCKYFCPFGALISFFNKISIIHLRVDETCTQCELCKKVCPMGIDLTEEKRSPECIECFKCVDACPHKSVHVSH